MVAIQVKKKNIYTKPMCVPPAMWLCESVCVYELKRETFKT